MKKKLMWLVPLLILSVSNIVQAKYVTIDGLSLQIPDEWNLVEYQTFDSGDVFLQYSDGYGGEPQFLTNVYPAGTIVTDEKLDSVLRTIERADEYDAGHTQDLADGVYSHISYFFIGDRYGTLATYDTGKSVFSAFYLQPTDLPIEIEARYSQSVENPVFDSNLPETISLIVAETENGQLDTEIDKSEPQTVETENTENALDETEGRTTADLEIDFRDIPWGSTKAEVENDLYANGATEGGAMSDSSRCYDLEMGINHTVQGGGYQGWYYGLEVAGYSPEDTYCCYLFPIENGVINHSVEEAQFYLGWYEFGRARYTDVDAIYNDLENKLTQLYGEGVTYSDKYSDSITWTDEQGNQIRLMIRGSIENNNRRTLLGYMMNGAEEKLKEMQEALNEEAAAAEAVEREKNRDNTSGL